MFPERLAHIKLQSFQFFSIATRFIEPNVKTAFFHPQQHFIHQSMKPFALNDGQKRRKTTKKTTTTFNNINCLLNERESSPKSSIYEIISHRTSMSP